MTPEDDIIDPVAAERPTPQSLKQRQNANAQSMVQQRMAAEKWTSDSKKNALLFPLKLDFS